MKRLDWKFLVMLAATLAGVVAPILLWRADLESRSLRFVVLSRASLQPTVGTEVPDLKVTLNGVELSSPTLTVVRLSNDGAQPIPASDFEGKIRLVIAAPAKLVRASVTEVSPTDLSPSLTKESNSILIAPMLLNPGDSITFALLTSGTPKTMESKARIAGLRTVPIEETPKQPLRSAAYAFFLVCAFVCMIGTAFFIKGQPFKGTYLRPRAAFLVTVVTATTGASIIDLLLKKWGFEGDWQLFVASMAMMLIAQPLSRAINKPPVEKNNDGNAA